MGYGDATMARGAHVGQGGAYAQAAAAQSGSQCQSPMGQVGPKRVLGGFNAIAVIPGANGVVNITTQVPVVMRCLTTTELASPFHRVTAIFVGTINHLVGGTVPGDSFLPIQRCTSLVDGIPLVPGMTLAINFLNIGGAPLIVEYGVDAELMCP
jgi:hypothetical protein